MEKIDFRSDTVTLPTPEMIEAMSSAKLGDDVYGEDPTVNKLEAKAAEITGKEAAVFVPSGTMGNLVAILSHAGRGDQAIVGEDSHSYVDEAGGMAVLGGIMPHPLPTDTTGRMAIEQIKASISPDDPHNPPTRLILLENTYGDRGGYPIPLEYFSAVQELAQENNLRTHLDGARFFNATVALGIDPKALASTVDSVSFCLSKGLCAPVGSLICGSADFIYTARRNRKILGGAMRQAGVLAAAGIVALDCMIDRLQVDHATAAALAQGLSEIPGIKINPNQYKTNMVFFSLQDVAPFTPEIFAKRCRQEGNIWFGYGRYGDSTFRAVTHYWVGPKEIDTFLQVVKKVIDG